MKRPQPELSDRQLKALLKGLREDVAAPADFRRKLLLRLQAEGLLREPLAPQRAGLRLPAWLSPARLGLGLGAAAAALLAFAAFLPTAAPGPAPVEAAAPAAPVIASAPAAQPASRPAPAALAQAHPAHRERPVQAAAAPEAVQHLEQPGLGAPAQGALGSLPQAAAAPSVQVASSSAPGAGPSSPSIGTAELKPTVIVPQETPTVLGKGLDGDSEVRNNVVRASRGEAALILFKVKQAGPVRVEIFSRMGRSVAVLRDEAYSPGLQSLRWSGAADDGGQAASGIYFVRIKTPDYEAIHKLVLVR